MTLTKKTTIDGIAYEQMRVAVPKSANTAQAQANQARKAYKLAKSDAKKVIKDAKRQRKQARLLLKITKQQFKLAQL